MEYGEAIRITVAWDNRIYEVIDIIVPSEKIGDQLGSIKREVSPKPEINGDIARNTPEGPPILFDDGGNLYRIKDIEDQKAIALETSKGVYCKCAYIKELA